MSKKNKRIVNTNEATESKSDKKSFWKGLGGIEKIGVIGLCLLLVVGVMGSGLGTSIINKFTGNNSTSNDSDNSRKSSNKSEPSLLSKLNPFTAQPIPSNTPQLSKSYIYAGSRMLAVEDANATAIPPADLAVWRPSSGTWWVLGGTGSQQTSQQWGTNGDIPTQGDFDGDGKTDFCVYRAVSGGTSQWWYINSSDNTTGTISFGLENDIPAVADFDGDGRTDFAVFRDSNTTWYYEESSTNTVISYVYGNSGDTPTPKDFDGDGKADIAVWRGSNTTFYSVNSSNSQAQSTSYGSTGDKPVPADYDGDGRADVAVFTPSTGVWSIYESSTSTSQYYQWGISTDTLVQNDYDGDGKVDVAVWRGVESASGAGDVGKWYIRRSSDGSMRTETWGIANDIPVPAYYRR